LICTVCGKRYYGAYHHIISRGKLRKPEVYDIPENRLPLCYKHHAEIHNIGRWSFVEKYKILEGVIKTAQEKTQEKEREIVK